MEIRTLSGCRLRLRYDDGSEGEVDLPHLAGQGVFQAWTEAAVFESARLEPHGAVAWGDSIELCPDALYLRHTGKTAEEQFPSLVRTPSDA